MTLLRARRSAPGPGAAPAPARREQAATVEAPSVPLEECLDRFWDIAGSLEDLQAAIEAPPVDAVPVKRLGEPGFWRNSKVDFLAAMTKAYQVVTRASLSAALGAEEA